MSKMKRMLEELAEHEDDIVAVLEKAKTKRPTFYSMVSQTPSMKTVKSLLHGITDDEQIILLATGYFSTLIKS